MKKILRTGIIAALAAVMLSCGGSSKKDQIAGEWKLTGFSDNGETVELSDCDNQTTWNFTTEAAEALGDGTETQKLNGVAPDECEFYSFDSKWTISDGKLFVSSCRVGGMGGYSLAGLMDIVELTDKKLVLKSMSKEITLEK